MKLKFTYPEFFMLAAARVVADRFEVYKDIFVRDHSNWEDPFISEYKKLISSVLSTYYSIHTREELFATTCFLWKIYSHSLSDLFLIKNQIEHRFENNPMRKKAILDKLGFTTHWNKASHTDQGVMFALLFAFHDCLSENSGFRAELENNGVGVKLLNNVLSYKEALLSSKIHYMGTRNLSTSMRETFVQELNDIYYQAMSICMIGKYVFKHDKTLQDTFNFSKIVKLNGSFEEDRISSHLEYHHKSSLILQNARLFSFID